MKTYQEEFDSGDRDYSMPNFMDGISMSDRWDRVIDTSYKFLASAQCDATGLVPNWAMATETSSGNIEVYPGSFSGSGTPQYEFGAEASRTMWRVVIDALLFPSAAYEDANSFLKPLHKRLDDGYSQSGWSPNTLATCAGVNAVFPNWKYNAFIYSPVYSTLALKMSGVSIVEQQNMVDAAGKIVNQIPDGLSYYSRCWSIIGILTLNGDIAKALSPSSGSTKAPSKPVTSSPTKAPTKPGTCKSWCATNSASWDKKCTWANCSLCDACKAETGSPTSAPTSSSTLSNAPTDSPTSAPTLSPTLKTTIDFDDGNDELEDDELTGVLQEIIVALNTLINILNQLLGVLGTSLRLPLF
jgi:hypothetical protein